jgi:hypothetical protein
MLLLKYLQPQVDTCFPLPALYLYCGPRTLCGAVDLEDSQPTSIKSNIEDTWVVAPIAIIGSGEDA